jgi:hypothetical protein
VLGVLQFGDEAGAPTFRCCKKRVTWREGPGGGEQILEMARRMRIEICKGVDAVVAEGDPAAGDVGQTLERLTSLREPVEDGSRLGCGKQGVQERGQAVAKSGLFVSEKSREPPAQNTSGTDPTLVEPVLRITRRAHVGCGLACAVSTHLLLDAGVVPKPAVLATSWTRRLGSEGLAVALLAHRPLRPVSHWSSSPAAVRAL